MKCPNCGKEIAEDSRFCEHCGKKIQKTKKKKTILWIVIGVVFALSATIIANNLYHESDAYQINFIKRIYSIDIPKEFNEQYYPLRVLEYTDGKGCIIDITGGHMYHWTDSLSAWFDYLAGDDRLALPKESFIQTKINQIPAMYATGNSYDARAYQQALLYSKNTGTYVITCSYPQDKKYYYDEIMRNVIFSFREK